MLLLPPGGGGCTSYNGLHWDATPERGTGFQARAI